MAQVVKNMPAMQETRVPSLGGEDPLEEEMATHSSILAWRITCTEEPGRLQSTGHKEIRLSDLTQYTHPQPEVEGPWTFQVFFPREREEAAFCLLQGRDAFICIPLQMEILHTIVLSSHF